MTEAYCCGERNLTRYLVDSCGADIPDAMILSQMNTSPVEAELKVGDLFGSSGNR